MTLDEAINVMKRNYDRVEKLNGSTGEYHSEYDKQIIEWLEELKAIKEIVNRPKECLGCFSNCDNCGIERYSEIKKIVKRGGKNDN